MAGDNDNSSLQSALNTLYEIRYTEPLSSAEMAQLFCCLLFHSLVIRFSPSAIEKLVEVDVIHRKKFVKLKGKHNLNDLITNHLEYT